MKLTCLPFIHVYPFFLLCSQNDETVVELDNLKAHSDVIDIGVKLEDSLKKLHDTNPHHKHQQQQEEQPPKKVSLWCCACGRGDNIGIRVQKWPHCMKFLSAEKFRIPVVTFFRASNSHGAFKWISSFAVPWSCTLSLRSKCGWSDWSTGEY